MDSARELDEKLMKWALDVGRRGDPSPNPHAGAVVARNEQVLGEGFHEAAGGPHAEISALRAAGDAARGATLYVTLEPCNHEGRTPPCVDSILQAGVSRVVIGVTDPNPRVPRGGVARLQAAGVEVVVGVGEAGAKKLILPWERYITTGRSYLAVKLALSLDGRTATRTGASKWITGPEARARVHALRSNYDAVMIGINTVLADDPQLTVRDVPGRNPVRIVIDSTLRIPVSTHLVSKARDIPTCLFATESAPASAEQVLKDHGVAVVRVGATAEGRCDMAEVLKELAAREVVSVLCEGGAELTGSLLAGKLPNEMHAFIAPILLGPRGKPGAVDWAGPERPEQSPRINPASWELCGSDAYVSGPLHYNDRPSS